MTADEIRGVLKDVPDLTDEMINGLVTAGLDTKDKLYEAAVADLKAVEGIDDAIADNIQSVVRKGTIVQEEGSETTDGEDAEGESKAEEKKPEGVMGIVDGVTKAAKSTIGSTLGMLKGMTGGSKKPEEKKEEAPVTEEPPKEEALKEEPKPEPEPEPKVEEEKPVEPVPEPEVKIEDIPDPVTPEIDQKLVERIAIGLNISELESKLLIEAGFKSIEEIKAADLMDLASIDGITLSLARKISE